MSKKKMGPKTAQNFANKKRTEPSDFDRVAIMHEAMRKIGYPANTGQIVETPDYTIHPDGMIKLEGFAIPLELDGPVHGNSDDLTESKQTVKRNDAYVRSGHLPIIVNEEWLKVKGISMEDYLSSVVFILEQWLRAKRRIPTESM